MPYATFGVGHDLMMIMFTLYYIWFYDNHNIIILFLFKFSEYILLVAAVVTILPKLSKSFIRILNIIHIFVINIYLVVIDSVRMKLL